MRMYRLELTLSQRDLIEFLDQNIGYKSTVTAIPEEQAPATPADSPFGLRQDTDAIYKPTRMVRQRRSKVVDTIMSVLQAGSAHPNQLKAALVEHGMSENSLATGLQVLQRENKISRAPDGQYVSNFIGEAA